MQKTHILLVGCNGRMGKLVADLIAKSEDFVVAAGYDMEDKKIHSFPVYSSTEELSKRIEPRFDLIIDFSKPGATMTILPFAKERNIPMVIATTGFTDEQEKQISNMYSEFIPIFRSSNMSYCVNVVKELLVAATRLLDAYDYDIEITETHHRGKADSPSGTAKDLFEVINEFSSKEYEPSYGRTGERKSNEIGISSQRCGSFPGTHTVMYAGQSDCIEITHRAFTPVIFAEGALEAARYLREQSVCRLYTMHDLLRL